jgi:ribosomal protein S12 methylthiotransferase accessory factor
VAEFRLASCLKHSWEDQDKAAAPAETVKATLAKLQKQPDLSHLKLEERPIDVDGAFSFASVSDQLTTNGKGLTPDQSEASAVMEFAERYSWLHFDYEHAPGYMVKSWSEMKKWSFPVPDETYFFRCFPDWDNREELLAQVKDIPLKWLKAVSLNDYRPYYYPLNWHNYTQTSNGLAAGNALEEAIVQALCEVIERENVFRFFAAKKTPRELDLRSVKHPLVVRTLASAAAVGVRIAVKDISFELGVPTFCVYGQAGQRQNKLSFRGCGYGAHTDPDKALIRALAEYFEGYSLMTNIEQELHFNWPAMLAKMPRQNYGFLALLNDEMLSVPAAPVKMEALRNLSRDDFRDEVLELLALLRGEGHDVFLIDKTHPRLGIPAVRVFVPTFRNVINTSALDRDMLMAMVNFEAGNKEGAKKYYRRSQLRNYYVDPSVSQVKFDQALKGDYREQLKAYGGLKRDLRTMLKQLELTMRQNLRS